MRARQPESSASGTALTGASVRLAQLAQQRQYSFAVLCTLERPRNNQTRQASRVELAEVIGSMMHPTAPKLSAPRGFFQVGIFSCRHNTVITAGSLHSQQAIIRHQQQEQCCNKQHQWSDTA